MQCLWNLLMTDIDFFSSLHVFTHTYNYMYSHTCNHDSLSIASETVFKKPCQNRVTIRDVRVPLTPRSPVATGAFTIDAAAVWPWRRLPRLHDRPLSWFINTVHFVSLKSYAHNIILGCSNDGMMQLAGPHYPEDQLLEVNGQLNMTK